MANYLLGLSQGPLHYRVRDLLPSGAASPSDIWRGPLTGGWELTWVARQGRCDVAQEQGSIFTGFAYDDDRQELYFGAGGWAARGADWNEEDLPGCHVSMTWDEDRVEVTTDLYRSMPLFLTTEPGLVLVSDSAYLLLQLRRRLGLRCSPDDVVAGSLRWGNAMSAQLMGSRTLVREISYVPVGQRLRLGLRDPRASAQVLVRPLRDVFFWDGSSYRESIHSAATRVASIIQTVASLGPEAARLSLSGGKDSRICLAAALLSPVARASARFSCTNTSPQHQRDAEVVGLLSQEFDFPLGARDATIRREAEIWRVRDPMGLWYLDNALAYYPVKLQAYGLRAKGKFAIAGYGSELYKGNYGLRSVPQIVASISKTLPDAAADVDAVCSEFLTMAGIDRDDPLSAEWHYLAMRNALHGGRFVPVSKFGIRPLQQRDLVGLSKLPTADYPEGMIGPKGITEDLIVTLGPEMAARPFDRPDKDRDPDWIMSRLKLLGGPLSPADISTYAVRGDPQTVADGPVALLADLADVGRDRGAITRTVVASLFEEAAVVVAASQFGASWAGVVEATRMELADASIPVGQARGMAGRILSLAEVLR